MATKPLETDDAFGDAFAQFTTPEDGTTTPPVEDDAPPADDTPPIEDDTPPVEDDTPPVEDDTPVDDDADDEEEDAPPVDDKPAADPDDVLKKLSALLKDAPPAEEAPAAPAQPEEGPPPLYTADEEAFLKTYDEDWSDVARGEALKRRAEHRAILEHVFTEVAKHLGPVVDLVNELATRTHLGDIEERVPDYADLRDNVVSWVEQQPAYLQAGMKEVMRTGTADEVADLISRYRKDTGQAATPPATNRDKPELSDTAKKAAKELAPVRTKRSVVPRSEDVGDYDAAFAKFAGVSGQ